MSLGTLEDWLNIDGLFSLGPFAFEVLRWGPGRKDGMKSRMKLRIVLPLSSMMGREVDAYLFGHLGR